MWENRSDVKIKVRSLKNLQNGDDLEIIGYSMVTLGRQTLHRHY